MPGEMGAGRGSEVYVLKDKVAVVTGAGSGIGRALAQLLAAKGCRLALADVNEKGLAETAATLKAEVITQKLDVADRAAVYAFAGAVKTKYGTAHVLINNAGVGVSQTIQNLSWEDFEWLMGINFWGVTYGTKAFLPMLLQQNEGAIVNISSALGFIAVPTQGAYTAAKFAVRGFTECLRHEMTGTGVKAICVHPGAIRTNIARSSRVYRNPFRNMDQAAMVEKFESRAGTTPEKAAAIIVRGIEKGSPRVLVGMDAWLVDRIQRWLPVRYHGVINALTKK